MTTFVIVRRWHYTKIMKDLIKATFPPKPKSLESKWAAYLFAGVLMLFALGQLFTFDEFVALLVSYNFLGGAITTKIIASMFVICEVFAIPFLLGMRLSKLARMVSMVLGWFNVVGWFAIALLLNLTNNSVQNFGILGTKIQLTPGWWDVSFMIAIGMLAAWSSWGLWPVKRKIS